MKIDVQKTNESDSKITFKVVVSDDKTTSNHTVTVDKDFLKNKNITDSVKLVESSFEFLLEREPKESILSRFNIKVISNYFPEYDDFTDKLK